MTKLLPLLFLGMFLSGCATSYQREAHTGGYSETRLAEDRFQVSFRGNAYTSEERVVDFALLRSAELATENGFRYFIVVDSRKEYSFTLTPDKALTHPRVISMIRCFKEKPEGLGDFVDAELVKKSLKHKYDITN